MKHLFFDDYSEGAHPAILHALSQDSDEQQLGYGNDRWCRTAAERVQRFFNTAGDVHFVSGATQANFIGLSSMLRPHQGVIAPSSGHINVHEAGATEATGHKIISVDCPDGKLSCAAIDQALLAHEDEHSVMPKVVYVTQATELGTVYTKQEFDAVVDYAKLLGLYVFVDGARLAMALGSSIGDMTPADIARPGVDMFSVGGTKVGGLLGEAIVICNESLRTDFRYLMKQRGALLAKGRAIGQQFVRFFEDDNLWLELGRRSDANATRLASGLEALGVKLRSPCSMNQVFPVVPDDIVSKLEQEYGFYRWARDGDQWVIRITCSWATPTDAIDDFLTACASLLTNAIK